MLECLLELMVEVYQRAIPSEVASNPFVLDNAEVNRCFTDPP